jgi:hypothetical protein
MRVRPTISDAAIVSVVSDVLAGELGPEVVMLNLRDATYYGLEDVGAEIWRLLQTPITIGRIVAALLEMYDVDAERCRNDVLILVAALADRGLVDVREPA